MNKISDEIKYGIDTRKLSIGDILLTKNSSLQSKGIRLVTKRKKTSSLSDGYSHAMIYIGGGIIAESTSDGLHKVCLSEFIFYNEHDIKALTYAGLLTKQDRLKIVNYINANEGAEYSFRDARRSASKKKSTKPHCEKFFCSRLIHRAYSACQMKIGSEYSNPNDLLDEKHLKEVEGIKLKIEHDACQDVMDIEKFSRFAIKDLLSKAREKNISSKTIRNAKDLISLASGSQDADKFLCELFDSIPQFKYYGMISHGEFYELISQYPDSLQKEVAISNYTIDFEDYLRAIFVQIKGTKDLSESLFERKIRSFYIEKLTASITRFNDTYAFLFDRESPSSHDGIFAEMEDISLKVIGIANDLLGIDSKGLDDLVIESTKSTHADNLIFNIICNSDLVYLPVLYHNKIVDRWGEYKQGFIINDHGQTEPIATRFCRDIARYHRAYEEFGTRTAELLFLLASYSSTNYFSILIKSFEVDINRDGCKFEKEHILHITRDRLDEIWAR